jgi:hypothetical protein
MITAPTTAQLVEVVRRELAERIAPAVTDPQAATSLQMVDHILATLAVRAEHELGWMVEEMAAIEAVGRRVAGSGLPGAPAVTEALAAFDAGRSAGQSGAAVTADYNSATEVLSRCIEATFSAEGPLRDEVTALLDQRLAHETAVTGPDFQLVGRQ